MMMNLSMAFRHPDRFHVNHRMGCDGISLVTAFVVWLAVGLISSDEVHAAGLWAGVAKVDITNRKAGPVNDPLYVKSLVIKNDTTTVTIVTLDAVAIGEIGYISNDYLGKVRARIEQELHIPPSNVLVNASHCHGVPCKDVAERTFQAVKEALQNMVPVQIGAGTGREDRIMENRRLKLKNGKEIDVRYAYSLPPDEDIAGVGPVDPEIGVLRLDRNDGRTLAVVYNFACHPIKGVSSGGNSADIIGFASRVIEDNLSDGTIALFLQGCAGDVNPVFYKDPNHLRDAEPLGDKLGLSTLKAVRKIQSSEDSRLKVIQQVIALPRADVAKRIVEMEAERQKLLRSLTGTYLNLKTFIALYLEYHLSSEFPSYDAHDYLHQQRMGRDDLKKLDAANRRRLQQYIRNIHTMEQLTRINTNLALLRKHQGELIQSGKRTIDVALMGLRIGDFVLLTFPGELSVEIGLGIKKRSPHKLTFIAGYTNGYIYYTPTAEQLRNVGGAQEDSDCLVAPEWQELFEDKAAEVLGEL